MLQKEGHLDGQSLVPVSEDNAVQPIEMNKKSDLPVSNIPHDELEIVEHTRLQNGNETNV